MKNLAALKSRQKGFTLIELLVVIAIIGVLTSLLLANMVGIRQRGADTKLKNDLRQLKTALRLYYNDNQTYPPGDDLACQSLPDVNSGNFVSSSGEIYMRDIPTSEDGCSYTQRDGGSGFLLQIDLENEGDPEAAESADSCGVSSPGDGVYYQCAD